MSHSRNDYAHFATAPDGDLKDLQSVERWHQDPTDRDLWHHQNGLIVNSAALAERESYYRIVRIDAESSDIASFYALRYPAMEDAPLP